MARSRPPAAPAPADRRESAALPANESAELCAGCVRCCSYVTIEIDPPRQAWEYDQWIWLLHHDRMELFVERPERWLVHVETTCRQLNAQGRCAIHGRHPVLCRDYDPRTCERRLPTEVRAWFKSAEELEAWIRVERPVHWERLQRYRRRMPEAPPVAGTPRAGSGLVTLASLADGSAASARPRPTSASIRRSG